MFNQENIISEALQYVNCKVELFANSYFFCTVTYKHFTEVHSRVHKASAKYTDSLHCTLAPNSA